VIGNARQHLANLGLEAAQTAVDVFRRDSRRYFDRLLRPLFLLPPFGSKLRSALLFELLRQVW